MVRARFCILPPHRGKNLPAMIHAVASEEEWGERESRSLLLKVFRNVAGGRGRAFNQGTQSVASGGDICLVFFLILTFFGMARGVLRIHRFVLIAT